MGYVDSFYARTRTDDTERPALDGFVEAQVCIVGGGLAGLNTALALAERGVKDVVLLEAERVGFGASGRNGGFVGPGYSQGVATLIKWLGVDHARALYDLTGEAVDLVRRRIAAYDIACGPNPEGTLTASWTSSPDGLKAYRDLMAETFGRQLEFIDRDRLRDEFADSPCYFDGLLNRDAFQFHPLNYCLGIARAAEQRGVRIYEASPVTNLDPDRARKLVVTPKGQVNAQHVVLAAGGYGLGLYAPISGAVLPVATYVMASEPIPADRLATAIKCTQAIGDTRDAGDYYRALPDGRILWGGRMTARRGAPSRLADLMLGDLKRVYPQLADCARVATAWMGTMSYARHRMPQIGQRKPGLWYAQAFGGSGMGTTTAAGEVLAEAIAGEGDRIRLFEPFGLDWAGGPFGSIAAQAAYWAYQANDWWTARHDRAQRRTA
jgi:gamma-glutamylputrescine oxidase